MTFEEAKLVLPEVTKELDRIGPEVAYLAQHTRDVIGELKHIRGLLEDVRGAMVDVTIRDARFSTATAQALRERAAVFRGGR